MRAVALLPDRLTASTACRTALTPGPRGRDQGHEVGDRSPLSIPVAEAERRQKGPGRSAPSRRGGAASSVHGRQLGLPTEEVVMKIIDKRHPESRRPASMPAEVLRPAGRFVMHLLEMCMVMCAGGIALSVAVFGGAALLGYDDLPRTAPELSVLIIAVNLSVPMLVWMRFRGMAWQPTLEMSASTMVVGLLLITTYWLDLLARDSLIELQTSLACPVMVVVMLLRFRLYSASHFGHVPHGAHA